MIIYQADAFDISLPGAVDLVISSPPIGILRDDTLKLFKWIENSLSPKGVFILECPAMYNAHNYALNRYTTALIEKRGGCALKPSFSLALYDFYRKNEIESLYFYSRLDLEPLTEIGYRKCYEREMSHRCEFDAVLVSNLIERFSKKGQTVLDPFCGTGTVPRIAHKMERNGIGIDKRCPYTNEDTTKRKGG